MPVVARAVSSESNLLQEFLTATLLGFNGMLEFFEARLRSSPRTSALVQQWTIVCKNYVRKTEILQIVANGLCVFEYFSSFFHSYFFNDKNAFAAQPSYLTCNQFIWK